MLTRWLRSRRSRFLLFGLVVVLVPLCALGGYASITGLTRFLQRAAENGTPTTTPGAGPGLSACDEPGTIVVEVEPAPAAGAPALPPPPGRPIQSLAFLELPFPYDGGNENFGGTAAQFRQASQRSWSGGRINSFFDHLYPLYPGATFGREPAAAPVGEKVLVFDGTLSDGDYYSGHPAYDYSTFVPRQPTTPVFAAADGVVYDVNIHSSGALYVKLRHTVPEVGDFLTVYWHLHPDDFFEAMRGRVGETVPAGTRLGTMGNTGWSTGHHLHFEVRFDRNRDGVFVADEVVDPYGFIPSATYPVDPWGQDDAFADAHGQTYSHVASASPYLWIHPLGIGVQIPETDAPLPDPGVGGAGGALCLPAGSVPAGSTVYWNWSPDPPPTDELAGVGESCVVSAFDPQGAAISSFGAPLLVALPVPQRAGERVDAGSLAIYFQAGEDAEWQPLATTIDADRGMAVAEVDQPGRCALLGQPLRDLVQPRTTIQLSGPAAPDGTWYDEVTVALQSEDSSGIERVEYSLDAGATWQPYSGPFTIAANGVPEPLPDEIEESFGGGPGRFLVLAAARDAAGNMEDPPAYRAFVIDPSEAPQTGTPSATPSATPSTTPTPTITPTGDPCLQPHTVTAQVDANVRGGPGTNYNVVGSLLEDEMAPVIGRNDDASWWRITEPGNDAPQQWISASIVDFSGSESCVPVVASPPTPTPTPTATATATATPTATPSPTPTSTDEAGCPRMTALALTVEGSGVPGADPILVNWSVEGGCEPFTGLLTARYVHESVPYNQWQVTGRSGSQPDDPPAVCPGGTYEIEYRLLMTDGMGHTRTAVATHLVTWIC